jgi:hypothetical protein
MYENVIMKFITWPTSYIYICAIPMSIYRYNETNRDILNLTELFVNRNIFDLKRSNKWNCNFYNSLL